jgi:2-oxo-4-hydroxy-4-carboxy--5-ureidoimidazoline (OHCU) decarboxylase
LIDSPLLFVGAPANTLSKQSHIEQGYSSAQTANDHDTINTQLQELNQQYEDTFGFKFVEFVNGRARKEMIPIIQQRLQNTKAVELEAGLSNMMAIARDRLQKWDKGTA